MPHILVHRQASIVSLRAGNLCGLGGSFGLQVDLNAGNAGALARRGPEAPSFLYKRSLERGFSRFALNAGEGARAPSSRLSYGKAASNRILHS